MKLLKMMQEKERFFPHKAARRQYAARELPEAAGAFGAAAGRESIYQLGCCRALLPAPRAERLCRFQAAFCGGGDAERSAGRGIAFDYAQGYDPFCGGQGYEHRDRGAAGYTQRYRSCGAHAYGPLD